MSVLAELELAPLTARVVRAELDALHPDAAIGIPAGLAGPLLDRVLGVIAAEGVASRSIEELAARVALAAVWSARHGRPTTARLLEVAARVLLDD